nr:hypothetical protein [Tanacetum cinerariifolium]
MSSPAHTNTKTIPPTDGTEESEPIEASETRIASPHSITSPLDSISPLSPDHPLTQTSPTPAPSQAFFYRSTSGVRGRGPGLEIEEAASEDQQQQAVLVEDTTIDEPSGLGYKATRRRTLDLVESPVPSVFEVRQSSRSVPDQQVADETLTPKLPVRTTWEDPKDGTVYIDIESNMPPVHAPFQTPTSLEWLSNSLPISLASLIIPTHVASPVPATTVGEGDFLDVGA